MRVWRWLGANGWQAHVCAHSRPESQSCNHGLPASSHHIHHMHLPECSSLSPSPTSSWLMDGVDEARALTVRLWVFAPMSRGFDWCLVLHLLYNLSTLLHYTNTHTAAVRHTRTLYTMHPSGCWLHHRDVMSNPVDLVKP